MDDVQVDRVLWANTKTHGRIKTNDSWLPTKVQPQDKAHQRISCLLLAVLNKNLEKGQGIGMAGLEKGQG